MSAGRSAAHRAARHRAQAAAHRRTAERHEARAAALVPDQAAAGPATGEAAGPRPTRTHRRRRPSLTLPRPSRRSLRLLAFAAAAAVVLACLPVAVHRLGDVLTSDVPDAAAAGPTVAAPVVYRDCKALRSVYSDGVKASGAANAGRRARPVTAVDTALATANGRLDDDGDGLVCERLRTRHRAAARH
jgi:hypothetical protein